MIEEIKRHVSFLQTGDRVLPGVAEKFAEFHRWTLEQLRSDTVRKPRKETWKIRTQQGELQDTGKPLPPKLVRSERYLALERLLVLLATVPRMLPAERRERAQDITEACVYLENVARKRTRKPSNSNQNRIPNKYRSKPISKSKAAKLLGRKGNRSSVVEWLNQCIADETITAELQTRQSFVFDIRQFPASAHPHLRPDN